MDKALALHALSPGSNMGVEVQVYDCMCKSSSRTVRIKTGWVRMRDRLRKNLLSIKTWMLYTKTWMLYTAKNAQVVPS